MVDVFPVTIPELTGEKERRAYVCLPNSYEWDEEKRYPVLYMFDGQNVFFDEDATYGKSWGMKEYMEWTDTELIIAAVECNDSPDNSRLSEYSPYSFCEEPYGKVTGLGKVTMEWFIHPFKDYIDANYRTLRGREDTFIAGSSMGGLMSLYALLEYNQYFSGAAALSPSIWAGSDQVRKLMETAYVDANTVLYMDCGDCELGDRYDARAGFAKAVELLIERGIKVTARIVPGGNHSEASWEKQIPFFMNTLLYDET